MAAFVQENDSLPIFVSSLLQPTPLFYFRHIIDSEEATLTVQVIGPNLEFKFTHGRAKELVSKSRIRNSLETKTVGFLTHVRNNERTVLAIAESGHGASMHGDVLDSPPGILSNELWAKRVVAVGKILGLTMGSPFDTPGGTRRRTERRGLFLGAHVEVKLAVHAVYVLLSRFGITSDFRNVKKEHLMRLRGRTEDDGTSPVFEVYFSRKNCRHCGVLVKRLAEMTGVRIDLCWKDRLVLKEYDNRSLRPWTGGQARPEQEQDPQDLDLDDFLSDEDSSGDETIANDGSDDDVVSVAMVDLISHPPRSRAASLISIADPVDDYIDGLAYRVGQLNEDPGGAIQAIVEFARKMREMYAGRRARLEPILIDSPYSGPICLDSPEPEPEPQLELPQAEMPQLERFGPEYPLPETQPELPELEVTLMTLPESDNPTPQNEEPPRRCNMSAKRRSTLDLRNINKPLPATPVIELPAWMSGGSSSPEIEILDSPPRVRPQAQPRIGNKARFQARSPRWPRFSPSRRRALARRRPHLVVEIPSRRRATGTTSEYFEDS